MARYAKNKRSKKDKYGKFLFLLVIIAFIIINIKFELISRAVLIINPILIEKIEISSEVIELEPGESIDISSKIYPDNYSKSELVWYSDDSNIIDVQEGKAIAKSVR